MEKYFCKNCGMKFSGIKALAASTCRNHPKGSHQGNHKLYEGSEKSRYTCKYCGMQAGSIAALTASTCRHHPDGNHQGKHKPAL